MRKPVLPDNFETYDFLTRYKNEPNPATRIRLLGLTHLQEGKTFAETANILKVERHTVSVWLRRFTEKGFEGLRDAPRSGPDPFLPPEQEMCFQRAVIELQNERKGGRVTGEDIRKMLRSRFNVDYKLRSVYDLLKRLGLVWITARSKHPKSDEAAQETFKKTSRRM